MAKERTRTKLGRVTPKGTKTAPAPKPTTTSGRYTPPIPREQKVSPKWVPVLMFTLLALGMLTIVCNYLNLLPGEDPENLYLLIGLGLITGGFVTATKYH